MRKSVNLFILLLPVALVSTYLITSAKNTTRPSDFRDAPAALSTLQDTTGEQTPAKDEQPIQPARDFAWEKGIADLAKAHCAYAPADPGCPLFCKDHHAYPGCPQYCEANPMSQACKNNVNNTKSLNDKSAADLAKANCVTNPMNPGCPMYCKKHHAYPGCPMYCQLNPLSPACKKDNGTSTKSVADENDAAAIKLDDKSAADLAKANCVTNPMNPGCPMYCKKHHAYPGCPMYCQLNPLSPACKKDKEGAIKSIPEDSEAALAKANCVSAPANPGCPLFCKDHHAYPGCPQYCEANPMSSACR